MYSDAWIKLMSCRGSIYPQRTSWPQVMGMLRALASAQRSSNIPIALLGFIIE